MQRQHQGAAIVERRLGTADLRHAGQKCEDVAVVLYQGSTHGAGECIRQVTWLGDVARSVADGDRKHAPGALDHLRAGWGARCSVDSTTEQGG